MREWISLSSVDNWTWAIGRLARTADGRQGTVLYFVFGDPVRVTLQTGRGLVTVLAGECQVLVQREEASMS